MDTHRPQRPSTDLHLGAWNGAFWDLGLKWHWDATTFARFENFDDRQKLAAYIEESHPHLLRAYDRDFLIDLIHSGKERRRQALAAAMTSGERAHLSCNGLRAAG